ncbi:DNA replication/repair protein RecF [soil metagenome]
MAGSTLLTRFELRSFRNYEAAEVSFGPGLNVLTGGNGEGKTNLLAAVAWLATTLSFRGAPAEALVRSGDERAVLRADVEHHPDWGGGEPRRGLVEAELSSAGRERVLVNRVPLRRARDLLGTLRVSVFTPDDLVLVKGGPGERRRFLDDAVVSCVPRHAGTRSGLERVLRQRGALLRSSGGRASPDVIATLDVWDAKLTELGEALGRARAGLVERLGPLVADAYRRVATAGEVTLAYVAPWRAEGSEGAGLGLAAALAAARGDDLRRGVSTVGPHRDELELRLDARPARTHASQGEQRSVALALRLAAHAVVTDVTGLVPVLLLDDVFSELDAARSSALLGALSPGQALLTTAGPLPVGAVPELVVRVRGGRLLSVPSSPPLLDDGDLGGVG